jgi:hypothetical protein
MLFPILTIGFLSASISRAGASSTTFRSATLAARGTSWPACPLPPGRGRPWPFWGLRARVSPRSSTSYRASTT